jgi:Bacterial protein of unknown function (DUF899)
VEGEPCRVQWHSVDLEDRRSVGRPARPISVICYLRQGSSVFETYWTTARGVEAMDNSYALLDMTVYGRQEEWEDSPTGWPKREHLFRTVRDAAGQHLQPSRHRHSEFRRYGRPTAQWSRLKARRSDDLGTGRR